jgi:hypothetical protein
MGKVKPLPPEGLNAGGRTIWNSIVGKYDLRPDELATLEDACRITDMIDALDAVWAEDGRPATAKGSMGQLIIHPIIGEVRTQRMARNALWRQLKLPDLDEPAAEGSEPAPGVPNQARSAANSRWAAAHGKAG